MAFIRPEHEAIAALLRGMNHDLLIRTRCYFGGGTAIVLKYGEYRKSLDIDFLCSDADGYRQLRIAIAELGPHAILSPQAKTAREPRLDRYGIRMFLEFQGHLLKLEIVQEANIELTGAADTELGVPILSVQDMFATKLMANADRWADSSVASRDAIDLGMLLKAERHIPPEALAKAERAYGDYVKRGAANAVNHLLDQSVASKAAAALQMSEPAVNEAVRLLRAECRRIWPDAIIKENPNDPGTPGKVFYAHSGNLPDKSDWQTMPEHALAVAQMAARMLEPFGLGKAAYLAGLFHDLGKYNPAFQLYIDGKGQSVDHSTAGARLLSGDFAQGADRSMAQLVAYAIAGHHAGLPDFHTAEASCLKRRLENPPLPLDDAWKADLAADATGLAPPWTDRLSKDRQVAAFQFSLMVRAVFSALVDADFKDTERHYARLENRSVEREWPELQDLLPSLRQRFDAHMADKVKTDTELNRLRRDILAHVRGKASERSGLFTLTVPTGGGKTLASLGFALDHAKAHGHSRIIYAIPFTSVTEQTAAIFKDVLGEEHVLEHHSALDDEKLDRREEDWKSRDKLKLAMEDWAAPVVVTTNVQLFESLFAARTSRARKVHNIFDSIIILDEAQTLPRPLLLPVMRMLEELALNYRCTIVLCTATQPALDVNNLKGGLSLEGRELAPDPEHLFEKLRRNRIERTGAMSNDDLTAALKGEDQALVIVNSRKHALGLFRHCESEGLEGVIHLSTRQYAGHRRDILKAVKDRLRQDKPCRVIATSLIEAGVDIDFPRAWRAEAGLDQIIQAAGRVNREGRREVEKSSVTVFSAPDYPPPSEIKGLVEDWNRSNPSREDLQSLDAIKDYFREVYWRVGEKGLDSHSIREDFKIVGGGTDFAFRTVAEKFRMIDSPMMPVIVPGDAVAKEAVDKLGVEKIPTGQIARLLQPYIVQVPAKDHEIMIRNGHVKHISPDLRGDQFAVLQTMSLYKPDVGLVWEEADYLAAEISIIDS